MTMPDHKPVGVNPLLIWGLGAIQSIVMLGVAALLGMTMDTRERVIVLESSNAVTSFDQRLINTDQRVTALSTAYNGSSTRITVLERDVARLEELITELRNDRRTNTRRE